MIDESLFFDDDLEALERARLRGNPLLEQAFQPTPLEAILDGIGGQQTQAPRQNQARDRLQVVQTAAPLDGPVTLRLNGQVLDENVITSARELDSLRNNPGIPQLVQDQIMVASQDGDVRVLSGQGQGPDAAEGSASVMLAGMPPQTTPAANRLAQSPLRTNSRGETLLDPIIVNSEEDEVPRLRENESADDFLNRLNEFRARRAQSREFLPEPDDRSRVSGPLAVIQAGRTGVAKTGRREFSKMDPENVNFLNKFFTDPVGAVSDLERRSDEDTVDLFRTIKDDVPQLPITLFRTLTDGVVGSIGESMRQAGSGENIIRETEKKLKLMLLGAEIFVDFVSPCP